MLRTLFGIFFDGKLPQRLRQGFQLLKREGALGLVRAFRSLVVIQRRTLDKSSEENLPSPAEFWAVNESVLPTPVASVFLAPLSKEASTPLVTVVIPSFGSARYLHDAIHSVAAATSHPHECIVVDDGNLNRATLLEYDRITSTASHQQLKIVRHSFNAGLSQARNTGLDHARGKYVVFLDDDDLLLPGSIDNQIEALIDSGSNFSISEFYFYDQVGCSFTWSDSGLNRLTAQEQAENPILAAWESRITIPIHSALFEASFVEKFNVDFRSKEDFEFWSRIFDKGKPVIVSKPAAIYRIHDQQMTSGQRRKHGVYFMEVIYRRATESNAKIEDVVSALKHVESYYGDSVISYWGETSQVRSDWLERIAKSWKAVK